MTIKNLNIFGWLKAGTAIVLIITATLKIASLQTGVRLFHLNDPVFPFITNGQMMALSAILELCTAAILLKKADHVFQFTALLGLSLTFLFYRLGLAWIAPNEPCPCLGRATDWLHLSPTAADTISKTVLAYLFMNSFVGLCLALQRQGRNPQSVAI
jgi:hypothetical protein